jgi:hypothetical protein
MNKLIAAVIGVIGVIALAIVLSLLLAWPVMWLWNNCLVGAVDGVHPVGFWQALGLMILCSFLFKSSSTTKSK